jgi:hypothetical protein
MIQFNLVKTFQIQLALKFSVVASAARTSVNALNQTPPARSIKSRFNHEWTRINTNSVQRRDTARQSRNQRGSKMENREWLEAIDIARHAHDPPTKSCQESKILGYSTAEAQRISTTDEHRWTRIQAVVHGETAR